MKNYGANGFCRWGMKREDETHENKSFFVYFFFLTFHNMKSLDQEMRREEGISI